MFHDYVSLPEDMDIHRLRNKRRNEPFSIEHIASGNLTQLWKDGLLCDRVRYGQLCLHSICLRSLHDLGSQGAPQMEISGKGTSMVVDTLW